jgi:hypothetical protein
LVEIASIRGQHARSALKRGEKKVRVDHIRRTCRREPFTYRVCFVGSEVEDVAAALAAGLDGVSE